MFEDGGSISDNVQNEAARQMLTIDNEALIDGSWWNQRRGYAQKWKTHGRDSRIFDLASEDAMIFKAVGN